MDFPDTLNYAFTGCGKNIDMLYSVKDSNYNKDDNKSIILAGNVCAIEKNNTNEYLDVRQRYDVDTFCSMEDLNITTESLLENMSDSGFCSYINQSLIISGNVCTIEESNDDNIYDSISDNEKTIVLSENENIDDDDNEIDILNTNIDAISHESFQDSKECKIDLFASMAKPLRSVFQKKLTPLVNITSSEQSNGLFRVQIHLKGFAEDEKPMAKLKFNRASYEVSDNLKKEVFLRNLELLRVTERNSVMVAKLSNLKDVNNKENFDAKNRMHFSKRY